MLDKIVHLLLTQMRTPLKHLLLLTNAYKGYAKRVKVMTTNNVISATIKSYRLQATSYGRIVIVEFDQDLPCINDDETDGTTNTIRFTLRQLIAQLTNIRPEASDMLEKVNLAAKSNNATLMQAFLKVILTDATYEIESIKYEKDEVFDDGSVAQSAGYRRNLVAVTFAPAVEAKIKPMNLNDALAALGY